MSGRKPRSGKYHNPDNMSTKKIKTVLVNREMKAKDLAEKLGVNPAGLNYRFTKNDFDESELRQIADALDCDLELNFIMRDTGMKI